MRPLALLVVVFMVLPVWPVAQAEPVQVQAEVRLRVPVATENLQVDYPFTYEDAAGGTAQVPTGSCGSDHFVLPSGEPWFRFHEPADQNGCGEARLTLQVPAGAVAMQVSFLADRRVTQVSPEADLPVEMLQQLRFHDQGGEIVASHTYFDASAGDSGVRLPFGFEQPLEPGQAEAAVSWYFDDLGDTFGLGFVNPAAGQALEAVVVDAQVTFTGIPMAAAGSRRVRDGVEGDAVAYSHVMRYRIDESLVQTGQPDLVLAVPTDFTFDNAKAGDGRWVDPAAVMTVDQSAGRSIVLSGAALREHGAGVYEVRLTSLEPLEPQPLLYPLVLLLVAAPGVAGVVAFSQARHFRQLAPPEFAGTVRTLGWVLRLIAFLYAVLLAWILGGRNIDLLATWPLEAEAGLAYTFLSLALSAFVAMVFLWRRHLMALMRREAEEREKANRELARSNRELEQFAYVASHDLQEPLRMVASYTDLLRRRHSSALPDEAREFVDHANEGAQRMQRLINDLLAYSRVGTRGQAFAPVDLERALDGALRNLQVAIAESGARVHRTRLPTVAADEGQMVQLLQNLIHNGIKFACPGLAPDIHVRAVKSNDGWTLEVQDNGIGIAAEDFGRLFAVFQRLRPTGDVAGNGIGLAICKRIAERHSGTIDVRSQVGRGTTFIVKLPLNPGAPRPGESTPVPTAAAAGRAPHHPSTPSGATS